MFDYLYTFSEIFTFVAFSWVMWECIKLLRFFYRNNEKIAKLLTREFLTDLLTAVVTILMGIFLTLDFTDGVKALVIARPWVGVLNALALRRLYNHYKRL